MTTAAARIHMVIRQRHTMVDRRCLRLAATLLVVGELLSVVAGIFHPAHQDPNNHSAVFAEYANSSIWTAVHLGQFAGMAIIVAGLLVLVSALSANSRTPGVVGRMGAVGAGITLALYGVLQAVDGVALKKAVASWVSAPASERAARFASAEAVRWLEEAVRSDQSFVFGLTLVLFGFLILKATWISSVIGYLMWLAGLASMVQGWVLGIEGFSPAQTRPQLLATALVLGWSGWLLIVAWRMKEHSAADEHSSDESGRGIGERP